MQSIILQETLPAYCIPKVARLKTGESLLRKSKHVTSTFTKARMDERIGFERQPEREVARQAKFFQPTQPTPSPIRDRSGRLDDKKHVPSSRVNSCNEGLSSSDRTGRPVTTFNTADAKDRSRVRSSHEIDTFNVEDEELRKRMGKSIADHDENHEPMTVNEAEMDFRIPGLPHSVVKNAPRTSVRQFRKLRTTQIDMLFNKIYDRINHSILSVSRIKTNDLGCWEHRVM